MRKLLACLFVLVAFMFSCESMEQEASYTIGFAQCTGGDAWRQAMHDEMRREISFYPELDLIIKDANNNTSLQAEHIRQFIRQGVDLLIVSPNEAEPITPLVEEALEKGIPVIIVDRRTASSFYTAYVGADNYEIGKLAGNYVGELLGGQGKVLEIWGLKGSSPAQDRHRGFVEALQGFKDIRVVAEVRGEWEKEIAKSRFPDVYQQVGEVDLVFAHNDVMALGVYEYLKSIGQEKKFKFIGVDGLSGPSGGLQFVTEGILDATFLYPTGGEEIIRLASKILHKEPYDKENILNSTVIDSRNVHIMKQQTDKILTQQKSIERQQEKIAEQIEIYQSQRVLLYILLGGMVVIIILGALAGLALREKQEMNRVLVTKNREIIKQRDEIEKMARKADKATEAKFKFFTNISHEFRTPLTLILGPVDDILRSNISTDLKKDMQLIKNNANRLLHLVTQLMDFRKIENKKMKLQTAERDIVAFVHTIASSFKRLAQKRRIHFAVESKPEKVKVYFDADKLDKVLFNLLSNAFKFTDDGGVISVKITISDTCDRVILMVEDNGRGMSAEHVKHAFDRFYTGDVYNNLSTGLGLSLSKEFISLHKGEIAVVSERWKGTRFVITLPLGKEHLQAEEILLQEQEEEMVALASLPYAQEIEVEAAEGVEAAAQKQYTILLIEDNEELRGFLKQRLQKEFTVVEAPDGLLGLSLAFDVVPDLIISDIMLPNKGGLEVTATLKKDLRTAHVPVILLTAKDSIEQKIEGIQSGADLYVTKPFNYQYLYERVKSLIQSRERLKDQYSSEISVDASLAAPKQLDKKFINAFTAVVQKNLANPQLSANDIAESLGMSRVQLYRKAKSILGYSINDYVVKARLKKAKHLLLNSDHTITEIATEVGFSSPAYFSTAFKNHFGVSPSDFKASHTVKE
ncbi:hybrid sensor histidine kinase/response regulator transcription factor [Cesiribacter andamanensis]|uniref:histidine kinase n=1 Tax=Cesiribacter andamanensis AMV16 TaxID=1279009 RepID=M7NBW2_9BACT|nr:substrate-binding domain-containing protein [Cesiribacter andamanensis]EMR04676.1 Autoinducer 2 sensor kinase/phosphatase luxQ [Cesiribacter andamanensis AMV16]